MNTLQARVQRAVHEDVGILPYDSRWPDLFRREAEHLRSCIPAALIRRIEHFGSNAVPGLAAKPIRGPASARPEPRLRPSSRRRATTTLGVLASATTSRRGMRSSSGATTGAFARITF